MINTKMFKSMMNNSKMVKMKDKYSKQIMKQIYQYKKAL